MRSSEPDPPQTDFDFISVGPGQTARFASPKPGPMSNRCGYNAWSCVRLLNAWLSFTSRKLPPHSSSSPVAALYFSSLPRPLSLPRRGTLGLGWSSTAIELKPSPSAPAASAFSPYRHRHDLLTVLQPSTLLGQPSSPKPSLSRPVGVVTTSHL